MKNTKFSYVGFFVDPDELADIMTQIREGEPGLEIDITCPHITTEYQPTEINPALFGAKIKILIDGYGKSEENEGLLVDIYSEDPIIQAEIDKITENKSFPYIATSISENGEMLNTRKLLFWPIEQREIEGVFGGFVKSLGKAAFAVDSKTDGLDNYCF